jgi:hypothetical protein
MENCVLLLQVVLEVVQLPNHIAEGDGIRGRLVVVDEGVALVAATGCYQQVQRNGQLVVVELEVDYSLKYLLHVHCPCAFQLLRKKTALLVDEVCLIQVFFNLLHQFQWQIYGDCLQLEEDVILTGIISKVSVSLIRNMMQDKFLHL